MLTEMSRELSARDIGFLVALIPTKDEVADAHSALHDEIQAHCRRSGINCISLLPALRDVASNGAMTYFPVDIHWTGVEYEVAREEVGRVLAEFIE